MDLHLTGFKVSPMDFVMSWIFIHDYLMSTFVRCYEIKNHRQMEGWCTDILPNHTHMFLLESSDVARSDWRQTERWLGTKDRLEKLLVWKGRVLTPTLVLWLDHLIWNKESSTYLQIPSGIPFLLRVWLIRLCSTEPKASAKSKKVTCIVFFICLALARSSFITNECSMHPLIPFRKAFWVLESSKLFCNMYEEILSDKIWWNSFPTHDVSEIIRKFWGSEVSPAL